MANRLVYSTESDLDNVKAEIRCKHGKSTGEICYPCDIDYGWCDIHGKPSEDCEEWIH